jgi:dCMP deaminase
MISETMNPRSTWDETWLAVADTIAKRSRCSRAQVGAVIVDSNQRICSTGYNGAAATYPTDGECLNWCERAQGKTGLGADYEGCPSIHAEANALLYVDRSAVSGGTIFITCAPCIQCAKLISNSGLSRVVARVRKADLHRNPEAVLDYLRKCNISVQIIKE